MKDAPVDHEEMRLALLRSYGILDTDKEEGFDELVTLAGDICGCPTALISFVAKERQWFKATAGTDLNETPIHMSICAHAIQSGGFLEIPDTTKDPRTVANPLVTGPENVRFYAGALLIGPGDLALGTLCVLDTVPRELNDTQRHALRTLANQVMRQLELREALNVAEMLRREVDHRVKNSLQSLESLIRIQANSETSPDVRAALDTVQGRLSMVSNLHEALYLTDAGAMVELHAFIKRVIRSASAQMPKGVDVSCDLAQHKVNSRAASAVGMIVNEAMTNAAKYAFTNRDSGTFTVRGRLVEGRYVLSCTDDGVPQAGITPVAGPGTGLGRRIMTAAAQQLGGTCDITDTETGHVVTISFPAEPA